MILLCIYTTKLELNLSKIPEKRKIAARGVYPTPSFALVWDSRYPHPMPRFARQACEQKKKGGVGEINFCPHTERTVQFFFETVGLIHFHRSVLANDTP